MYVDHVFHIIYWVARKMVEDACNNWRAGPGAQGGHVAQDEIEKLFKHLSKIDMWLFCLLSQEGNMFDKRRKTFSNYNFLKKSWNNCTVWKAYTILSEIP